MQSLSYPTVMPKIYLEHSAGYQRIVDPLPQTGICASRVRFGILIPGLVAIIHAIYPRAVGRLSCVLIRHAELNVVLATMKSQGQIESAIRDGITRFE